jgi:uncharacterized protein YceK
MLHKTFLLIILAASCAGCASIATWHYSDDKQASFLQNRRTHCESLPRMYSGFYFDYCWLNSDPQRIYGSAPMALLIVDGFLSGIADTFALPVTIVQQRKYGVIPIARSARIPVGE